LHKQGGANGGFAPTNNSVNVGQVKDPPFYLYLNYWRVIYPPYNPFNIIFSLKRKLLIYIFVAYQKKFDIICLFIVVFFKIVREIKKGTLNNSVPFMLKGLF